MARPRPRHSTREKITAVIAAELSSNLAVERVTGIPNQTIGRWRDDPTLRIYVDKTRDALADEMRTLAALAVDTIQADVRAGKFEPRDLVMLLGVATEKSLLLTGDATSRTETRDITGTLADGDISAAIREAEAILGRADGGTALPPEDPPAG